jgi:hypothetical protein
MNFIGNVFRENKRVIRNGRIFELAADCLFEIIYTRFSRGN